jgi:hypothetical protein
MARTSSASTLLTQVELALLDGRNLEQIETELLADSQVDEDEQAAAWLYAWARGAGKPTAATGTNDPPDSHRRA